MAVRGVDRRSVVIAKRISVASVCWVAAWLVLRPVTSSPTIARKQNATTPRASVTSTIENAAWERGSSCGLMAGTSSSDL